MRLLTLFCGSVCAALWGTVTPAQELSEIVRDGRFIDVSNALEQHQWSQTDLSIALIAAAGLNRPAQTRLLLEAGADPNFQMLGSSVVVTAVRQNSVAALDAILENGGSPNMRTAFDWAPLHNAILPDGSRYQALELLVKYGADLNARTSLQVTPLHRAAGFCDARAVKALLEAGADPSLKEKYGRTAYQRSVDAECPGVGGLIEDAEETLSSELIEIMKRNHAESCQVAIRNQSETQGLGMAAAEIERHCRCVGSAYFDHFTQSDFESLQETGQLPPHLLARRENIQLECFGSSLTP